MHPILSYRSTEGVKRKGSLFDKPVECCQPSNVAKCNSFYQKVFAESNMGTFIRCPFGYAVFLSQIGSSKVCFNGLRIDGVASKGKDPGRGRILPRLTEDEARRLIDLEQEHILDEKESAKSKVLTSELLHGMGKLLGSCHANSEELLACLDREGLTEENKTVFTDRLTTILLGNVQLRNQFYLANYRIDNEVPSKQFKVQVYNKYFKARKMLRRYRGGWTNIRMKGNADNAYWLSSAFEVVPYLLLENAAKFTPNGGEVTVEFEESGSTLDVAISNVGPFTSKTKDELFRDKVRGENSLAAGVEGSGIGLYTCSRIAFQNKIDFDVGSSKNISTHINGVPYSLFLARLRFPEKIFAERIERRSGSV